MKKIFGDRIEYINDDGRRHRINGPAVKWNDGFKEWFQNGYRHRENGPATYGNGKSECWYKNGLRHRLDGPAIIKPNGEKRWYQNGKIHRTDGPAIECSDGNEYWWFEDNDNRFYSEKQLKFNILKCNNVKQFIANRASDDLDPGEIYLFRLTIQNHFPTYLDLLDKLLILK